MRAVVVEGRHMVSRRDREREIWAEWEASPMRAAQLQRDPPEEQARKAARFHEITDVDEPPSQPAVLTMVEMALRQRPACAWLHSDGILVGCDGGRPFVIALDPGIGITPAQRAALGRFRKAGARTGTAATIREALAVIGGIDAR